MTLYRCLSWDIRILSVGGATISGMAVERSFANLRQALGTPTSLLRRHLDARYPNQQDIYRRYREAVGPIIVPAGSANPGTLGTAFDWLIRLMVDARPRLDLATRGVMGARSQRLLVAFHDLAQMLSATPDQVNLHTAAIARRFDGPAAILSTDEDTAYRAMWALALLTEVYRAGLMPGSQLQELVRSRPSVDKLLALAPDDALHQLRKLRVLAEERLVAQLRQRPDTWVLGPTFDGSRILKADADLVVGGALIDVKTTVGRRRSDGTRQATVRREDLWQIICYALMDFSDEYGIVDVGLYAAATDI